MATETGGEEEIAGIINPPLAPAASDSVAVATSKLLTVASPNDIHYIEKLRNGFWSGNSHSRSNRQIALQHISN